MESVTITTNSTLVAGDVFTIAGVWRPRTWWKRAWWRVRYFKMLPFVPQEFRITSDISDDYTLMHTTLGAVSAGPRPQP